MRRSLISWLTAAGMVFAVVAVAAPCATAGRFGPGQPGATTTVEPRPPRALCHQYCGTVRRGPAAGGLSNLKPSLVPQVETAARDGFHWADAGIGAAAATGFGLAALGALALVRRRRLRRAALAAPFGAVLAVALAALASTGVATPAGGGPTQLQLQRCEGLVKGAPWTKAIQQSIGPGIVRGSRYAVWVGSWGPPCALAKSKTARLSRLRTPRALRRASFGGLKCRISPLSSVSASLLSVRPRTALSGCWTTVNVPGGGPYFYWQPRR